MSDTIQHLSGVPVFVCAPDGPPLRDFVRESDRGTRLWFVPDTDALRSRLAGR